MKNIWIIGAGASISNNKEFPSIFDFFSRAKEYGILSDTTRSIKETYLKISEYASLYLHKNIMNKNEKTDIEQFLTHLYIEYDNTKNHEIATYIEKIIILIQEVLYECESRTTTMDDYNSFLNNFVSGKETTIISFNWDLLLDTLMKKNNTNQYNQLVGRISAKFLWGYLNGSDHHQPYSDYSKNQPIYVKLHGSIDWITCRNEHCRLYSLMYIKEDTTKDFYCSECHEQNSILLIPPILNKQYNEYPALKKSWNIAFKEIANASIITIWGYGVPPTDFYSNWLLSRSTKIDATINIINPESIIERRDSIPTFKD